ncbi:ABC transporter substrate-binding protein [Dactylosporangium sp. CA-092794]|uniref:ABC transporter substrate-binding protein n=1 Tax=Dactylosporangium sp. CA-092794 TaxID=3239929 RepID=UPI003D9075B3
MFAKRMRYATGAVAASALFLTAACSGGGSSSDNSIDKANPTGTVQFWTRSVLGDWAKQVVTDFNQSHKDLQVKLTSITDDQLPTKLAAAFRTDNVPDLVVVDPGQAVNYITSGNFLDITKQINAFPDKSAIAGPQLEQAKWQGAYYGTPAFLDASVLLYNKTLFTKAGISGPPKNLDEMLADAKAVKALGGDTYGITFGGACAGCLAFTALPNFWVGNDGSLIRGDDLDSQKAGVADNPGLKATLEFYKEVWANGLAPKGAQSENGTTWNKDFQGGNIGMAPAGLGSYTSAPPDVKANLAVAPLPTVDGGISTYIGGGNFGISKKAKNPAGAWEFIQYALSKEKQASLPETGFAPVRSDLLNDASFTSKYAYVLPEIQAAQTGFGLRTKYQAALFNDSTGPWLTMFQKAVFQGDVDGAIKDGQSGFTQVLSGNGR